MIYLNFYDLLDFISYQLEWILSDDNLDWALNFFFFFNP